MFDHMLKCVYIACNDCVRLCVFCLWARMEKESKQEQNKKGIKKETQNESLI